MKKLTKREKVLIYITIILVIVCAGVYFLIIPAVNNNMDLSSKLKSLKSEKLAVDIALNTIKDKELAIKDLNDGIDKVMNELNSEVVDKITRYGNMPNEEIDKLISIICEKYYVYPKNLTLSDPNEDSDDATSENKNFTEVKISLNATTTTRRNIQLVIDDLSKNFNFEIDSFWIIKSDNQNPNSVKKDLYTMNLTCRIIMTK